jgi:hypothetical protein
MKTRTLHLIWAFMLLFTSLTSSAKIWRVNNQSNYNGTNAWGSNYGGTATYPIFKQVNEAINWSSFTQGDTIHVEASNIIYDPAVINKRVVLIGAGYFINENPNVSNGVYDSKIARIDFETGSSNSQVMGMNVVNSTSSTHGYIYVNYDVNGVVIKRNRIEKGIVFDGASIAAQHISDIYILQNFFSFLSGANILNTNSASNFYPPDDITFNNNICQNKLIWKNSTTTWSIKTCHYNVFDGPANSLNLEFNSDSFRNNILKATGQTALINNGNNNQVSHNTVMASTVFNGSTGDIADMSTLFVNPTTNTTDGDYQLQPGSAPGSDGVTPRGVFGGAEVNRYQLSGLAPVPVIYQTTTTGVSTAGGNLPVQIKAKTIK